MSKVRVFVLGHRGMLGHVVTQLLRAQDCEVITSEIRYTGVAQDPLLQAVRESGCDWVINAIGLIWQKSTDEGRLFLLNSILPIHLVQELAPNQRLIHASTDCVFSGKRGNYLAEEKRDADEVYGLSKGFGEHVALDERALVMRVSIIGPDLGQGSGLLGWFFQQRGTIRGFTNHFWNGITTLEWAKAAWEIISGNSPRSRGLIQLGTSESNSKYDLLVMCNEIWSRDLVIEPVAPLSAINRTLKPEWVRSDIQQQLSELKAWMEDHPF